MWTQVVGKITLALTPHVNHYWNAALRVTPRGLATPPLSSGDRLIILTFDLVDHRLVAESSDGRTDGFPLQPMTVAGFYAATMSLLERLSVPVRIWTMPVEVPDPIRFDEDVVHQSYVADEAHAFWRALVCMTPVFERFRGAFIGKSSPVHFFWGSFDLASTRFSGRRAPERAGADAITREAYSHEVISHGFWPGGGPVEEPVFYAYAAPQPPGFELASIQPEAAHYSTALSEFLLPYDAVRSARSPETALTAFLETTYAAGADLARWARGELERQ